MIHQITRAELIVIAASIKTGTRYGRLFQREDGNNVWNNRNSIFEDITWT